MKHSTKQNCKLAIIFLIIATSISIYVIGPKTIKLKYVIWKLKHDNPQVKKWLDFEIREDKNGYYFHDTDPPYTLQTWGLNAEYRSVMHDIDLIDISAIKGMAFYKLDFSKTQVKKSLFHFF